MKESPPQVAVIIWKQSFLSSSNRQYAGLCEANQMSAEYAF